jgi:sulfide:quinone oxidoreductase
VKGRRPGGRNVAGKTIVVLGGGVGGLVAANRLRQLLPRQHRVLLIDRSAIHAFAPAFTWVMTGEQRPARIVGDLRHLQRKGIEVVLAEVTALDVERRRVYLGDQGYVYDYLVLSPGVEYSTGDIPGLGQAWTFYSLDGAEALAEELAKLQEGRIVILIPSVPYKCPAAPYEGALLLDYYFRRRGRRHSVEIAIFTPEPYPLPVAGPSVGEQVLEMLDRRGIRFTPGARVRAVDQEGRRISFADGSEAPFDLLIGVPVHGAPRLVREAGLVGPSGWIEPDPYTLTTAWEGVYALGDVTHIPLAHGLPLPKAGVFAHGEAETVARNIAAEIEGSPQRWAFDGHGQCFLETGYGRAALVQGDFFAEPAPRVELRRPGRFWHLVKAGFARWWLWRWL